MDNGDPLEAALSAHFAETAPSIAGEEGTYRSVVERAGRRVQLRRLGATAVGVCVLAAVAVGIVSARPNHQPALQVQGPPSGTSNSPRVASESTTTATTRQRPRGGYPYDLVGDGPPITLDHTGRYSWTSPVVIQFTPKAWNWSYEVEPRSAATIRPDPRSNRLVKVPGGYSLRSTFVVTQLSGRATLQVIASAEGPDTGPPPGYVAIPNLLGMTEAHARSVLGDAELGVLVATEGSGSTHRVVLAQSPCSCGNIRKHGVITITVGGPR